VLAIYKEFEAGERRDIDSTRYRGFFIKILKMRNNIIDEIFTLIKKPLNFYLFINIIE